MAGSASLYILVTCSKVKGQWEVGSIHPRQHTVPHVRLKETEQLKPQTSAPHRKVVTSVIGLRQGANTYGVHCTACLSGQAEHDTVYMNLARTRLSGQAEHDTVYMNLARTRLSGQAEHDTAHMGI